MGHRGGFSLCWALKVTDSAHVANMYSMKLDSMTIKVSLYMWHDKTTIEVLLDCGATHNFIDKRSVKKLHFGTRPLKQPLTINNVDGTIRQKHHPLLQSLAKVWRKHPETRVYVASLGRDRLILGHPWFKNFNPTINWSTNQLEGEDVTIEMAGYQSKSQTLKSRTLTINPTDIETEKTEILTQIPEEYHQHWWVFSEKASQHYPPAQDEDQAITLKPGAPATMDCKIYQQTDREMEATHQFIDEHLAKGYIKESNSPYASPIFYQAKKDGTLHPIMDYHFLKSWTIRDTYPLPLINDIIDRLQGKILFTKFNICWGYNNICIKEEDQWAAAFKTPFGLYQPTVMYYGLTNSPATFCRTMGKIFCQLKSKYFGKFWDYMDDLLVAMGPGEEKIHQDIVHEILDILETESYFLRPSKCVFEQTRIEHLGIIVDGRQLTVDPKKAAGLCNWPCTLKTVKEVCSILGVLGYQRPFIANFANIAWPLVALTKKGHPFTWTPDCQKALDILIDTVLSNPSLHQPNVTNPFFLQVDTSAYATGAILTQKDERGKHITVGFHSQTFNEAEWNYNIHDHRLLAVYRGLTAYCHLLIGSPHSITVYTDHKNLEYYCKPQHINWKVTWYIPWLVDYNFQLVHIPGTTNKADALSRWPDFYNRSTDNANITVLPKHLFAQATTLSSLDDRAKSCQLLQQDLLKKWATTFSLKKEGDLFWYRDWLVVVKDLPLRRGVISLYHDSQMAGHPGIPNTTWAIARNYWWPNMKQTITDYIKGCTLCQSRKNHPTKTKVPSFPIPSDMYPLPFTSIALDFITKLPLSNTYNTILTIMDTFSKAYLSPVMKPLTL